MAGFTKADMRSIFRQGIFTGLCNPPDNDTDTVDAVEQITEDSFNAALAALKAEKQAHKPGNNDARLKYEAWVKGGRRREDAPLFPEFFED